MSPGVEHPTIFRIVEGLSGDGRRCTSSSSRASTTARSRRGRSATGDGLTLVAGSDALRFHSPVPLQGDDLTTDGRVHGHGRPATAGSRSRGTRRSKTRRSRSTPAPRSTRTAQYWSEWMERCTYQGEWRDDVVRSLITVKALQYAPTGAVCAAATTSLPEQLGGVRNWDYRFSWLRDSSLTLQALVLERLSSRRRRRGSAGCSARSRAIPATSRSCTASAVNGGSPRSSSTGCPATRTRSRSASATKRASSSSSTCSARSPTRRSPRSKPGSAPTEHLPAHHPGAGELLPAMMEHLERVWQQPDDGIWEIRGPQRHFTQSKVMAWVAFDRAAKIAEHAGTHRPADRPVAQARRPGEGRGLREGLRRRRRTASCSTTARTSSTRAC